MALTVGDHPGFSLPGTAGILLVCVAASLPGGLALAALHGRRRVLALPTVAVLVVPHLLNGMSTIQATSFTGWSGLRMTTLIAVLAIYACMLVAAMWVLAALTPPQPPHVNRSGPSVRQAA
ncbi:hypothetical protein GCM10022234_23100 [Aeromicrobium panaciterrae]